MKNTIITNLTSLKRSLDQIEELIGDGCEFSLHFGVHKNNDTVKYDFNNSQWLADFTRKMENCLWDNHESGLSDTIDGAINIAYHNIKNGKKLNPYLIIC